jgi:hypothetical protein
MKNRETMHRQKYEDLKEGALVGLCWCLKSHWRPHATRTTEASISILARSVCPPAAIAICKIVSEIYKTWKLDNILPSCPVCQV